MYVYMCVLYHISLTGLLTYQIVSSGWVVYAASFPSLASRCPYRLKWVAVSLVLVQERLCGVRVQHGFFFPIGSYSMCSYFPGNLLGPIKSIVLSICIFNFSSNYCLFLYSLFINLSLLLIRVQHSYHINSQTRILIYHIFKKKCCTQIKWIVIGYALFSLYIYVFSFFFSLSINC